MRKAKNDLFPDLCPAFLIQDLSLVSPNSMLIETETPRKQGKKSNVNKTCTYLNAIKDGQKLFLKKIYNYADFGIRKLM